jgi:hypothetical protein
MSEATYLGCAVASFACAFLLLRGWRASRHRLLLWSGLCFAGLALNSIAMVVDLMLVSGTDLRWLRHATAHAAMAVLLFGLVWERP